MGKERDVVHFGGAFVVRREQSEGERQRAGGDMPEHVREAKDERSVMHARGERLEQSRALRERCEDREREVDRSDRIFFAREKRAGLCDERFDSGLAHVAVGRDRMSAKRDHVAISEPALNVVAREERTLADREVNAADLTVEEQRCHTAERVNQGPRETLEVEKRLVANEDAMSRR